MLLHSSIEDLRCYKNPRSTLDSYYFFFFNDTATTEIYTLSLHDALPIYPGHPVPAERRGDHDHHDRAHHAGRDALLRAHRSEEHTSELQSQSNLVCRLLLEKKKKKDTYCCSVLKHTSITHTYNHYSI